MKHRKDWTAWKYKKESELRQRREMQKIMDKLVEHWSEEAFKTSVLLTRMGRPAPLFSGGVTINSPIIYREFGG